MRRVIPTAWGASLLLALTWTQAHASWLDKVGEFWDQSKEVAQDLATKAQEQAQDLSAAAQDFYQEKWGGLSGEVTVCVAKELKDWINTAVVPPFKAYAPKAEIKIEAHGSGDLADAMNGGNSMGCDILIPGSDVSGMRWKGYDIGKRKPVAYSATVWAGDKAKLDAARSFLGKAEGDALGCADLSKVAKERRYGRIQEGGVGKLTLEMTTSNSGQSMYVSCVYSIVDAFDPREVEDRLNKDPDLETKVREFFEEVKFDSSSTTTLTVRAEGGFMHPNGIGYNHLAIATYESFVPYLTEQFAEAGKELEVIYPEISIMNNFPATVLTKEGDNAELTKAFLDYLLAKEAQDQLVEYGFRPANPQATYLDNEKSKYFVNDIEVGDTPNTRQMLKDMWGIVSDMDKAKAVQFD